MRDAPRLHLLAPLAAGARVILDQDRRHYLVHVMRAGEGSSVRVFNAEAGEWDARIERLARHELVLLVEERRRAPPDAICGPVLLFAPLKRDATDLVVRMATELGASSIRPVSTERSIAGRVNTARLALIAREAAEQCERLDLPDLSPPAPLAEILQAWPSSQPIAAAIERAGTRLLGRPGHALPAALLVGPEGGFSPAELDALGRRPFVQPVSLGPLVLRAETACAVGLALLQLERRLADVEPG